MHVHYACTRYIKAQSVSNAAATKKLLRAFAKQCGAEVDFDAMKRAEVEQARGRMDTTAHTLYFYGVFAARAYCVCTA